MHHYGIIGQQLNGLFFFFYLSAEFHKFTKNSRLFFRNVSKEVKDLPVLCDKFTAGAETPATAAIFYHCKT